MNDLALEQHSPDDVPTPRFSGKISDEFTIFRRQAVTRRPVIEPHPFGLMIASMSAAQSRAAELRQRVEHRLQIEGRAADDLKHVGGGGLLLQRFAQVVCARLHLLKQPHILDCDHRLVGEGLNQLDLLVGKRLDGDPRQYQNTDRLSLAQHRHAERGALHHHSGRPQICQPRFGLDVRNVDGFFVKHGTADDRRPVWADRMALHIFDVRGREAVARYVMVGAVAGKPDGRAIGAAQPGRRLARAC